MVLGFAATFGSAVTGSSAGFLEIRIVGVGDAVAVAVGELSVIRVGRELVDVVVLAVTVRVCVVRVGSHRVLLTVGQAIAVAVRIAVTTVEGVQAVRNLPTVGEAIAVAVRIVHVRSFALLFRVREAITVPVGSTIGSVEGVRPVRTDCRYGGQCHEQGEQYADRLAFLHVRHVIHLLVVLMSENPLFSLSVQELTGA